MSDNQQNMNTPHAPTNPYYYQPVYHPAYYRQMQPTIPQMQPGLDTQGMLPMQQSYIENILRLNRGKIATVYMTFESGGGGEKKVFKGRIEAAGRDHIILSDPENNKRYLLLMVYLDYVTFDEPINYSYPFGSTNQMATYESR